MLRSRVDCTKPRAQKSSEILCWFDIHATKQDLYGGGFLSAAFVFVRDEGLSQYSYSSGTEASCLSDSEYKGQCISQHNSSYSKC